MLLHSSQHLKFLLSLHIFLVWPACQSAAHAGPRCPHCCQDKFVPDLAQLLFCCAVATAVLFAAVQAKAAQRLHDERAAMTKTLAENDENIKAKKRAVKQQVSLSHCTCSPLACAFQVLCICPLTCGKAVIRADQHSCKGTQPSPAQPS